MRDIHKSCSIFGHRNIEINEELKLRLKREIILLIEKYSVDKFLFGSRSNFNDLCLDIVTELKDKYGYIVRIGYPCNNEKFITNKEYECLIDIVKNNSYIGLKDILPVDEVICNLKLQNAGKSVYIERNKKMIDDSDYCLFYYDINYVPAENKRSNKLNNIRSNSGTAIAYKYATKRNKEIINIDSRF